MRCLQMARPPHLRACLKSPCCRLIISDQETAFEVDTGRSAEEPAHVLPTDYRSRVREQTFALGPLDGKVCPQPDPHSTRNKGLHGVDSGSIGDHLEDGGWIHFTVAQCVQAGDPWSKPFGNPANVGRTLGRHECEIGILQSASSSALFFLRQWQMHSCLRGRKYSHSKVPRCPQVTSSPGRRNACNACWVPTAAEVRRKKFSCRSFSRRGGARWGEQFIE